MSEPPRSTLLGVSLKLYLDPASTAAWAERVAATAGRHPAVADGTVRLFVLPSLPSLAAAMRAFTGTRIEVGAQDLWWADRGPYTGAVSGADLAALGCRYVEIGHAERRRWFGEGDHVIGRKLAAAVRNRLVPVLCIGEPEGAEGRAVEECLERLDAVLAAADEPIGDLVVAYEPKWAIGAERSASPEHVDAVCTALRTRLDGLGLPGTVDVIYGGSAGPGLLSRLGDRIDGLFLGRSAHDPVALASVLDEAAALR